MPPHPCYVLRSGTTGARILVYARAANGEGTEGRTGLSHDAPHARAAYVREGEAARPIDLVPGLEGRWVSGSLTEVDPDLLPGVYEFHVPDDVLSHGASHAILLLRFPGVVIDPVEMALVGYDPRDPNRMGLESLDPVLHGRFLRRGMPGLAKMELDLWQEPDRGASRTSEGT